MTYTLSMADRRPSRIHISRSTGKLYTSDMVPCASPSSPTSSTSRSLADSPCYSHRPGQARAVPQRAGPVPLHAQLPALHRPARHRGPPHELAHGHRARAHRVRGACSPSSSCRFDVVLTPRPRCAQYDLEHRLSIFVGEEIRTWFAMSKTEPRANLRDYMLGAVDNVTRKARVLSCASSTSLTRPCLAPAASECGHARVRVDHAAPARRDGAAEPVADGPAVGRRPLELSCCVSSLVQIPLSPSLSQCAVPVCIPSSQ